MPRSPVEPVSRRCLHFLAMALTASSCGLLSRSAAAEDIYAPLLQNSAASVTVQEVRAVLANYPESTIQQDDEDNVKNCMSTAAQAPAPAAGGLPAGASALGGLQGMMLKLLGNSMAVGSNPAVGNCVARAQQFKEARMAEFDRATPPEARLLWAELRRFGACVQDLQRNRKVLVRGACGQEQAGYTNADSTPVMPNRGTLFGGATHWAVLSYSPGDENLWSEPMPKASSDAGPSGRSKQALPSADDGAALERWPKKMLTLQEAQKRLGVYRDERLAATKDPFVFTGSAHPDAVFIATARGYSSLTRDAGTPDCLSDFHARYLRIANTLEPTASCPRIVDMQAAAIRTGSPAPTPLPKAAAPLMAPPIAIVATTQALNAGATPGASGDGEALLRIEYIGQALSHRSGSMAIPATTTQVRMSMVVLAAALHPNAHLSVSSRQPNDHQYVKSVVVTDGTQSFDFNNPQHDVEVLLEADAQRNISSWRIRAARLGDNDNQYIRVFGPGFENDVERDPARFGGQLAGSECLGIPTDISFSRNGGFSGQLGSADGRFLAQSCAAGKWQISVPK